jgi:hypothetical protein
MGRLLAAAGCVFLCSIGSWMASPVGAFHGNYLTRFLRSQSLLLDPSTLPRLPQNSKHFVMTSSPSLGQCEEAGESSSDGRGGDVTAVLLSYRSNIRRATRELRKSPSEEEAKRPIRSLVYFLGQASESLSAPCTPDVVVETVIPALHLVASLNDYRLLLRLWEVTKQFCTERNLELALPRLLGESLTALGKTSASLSKVKRLWRTDAHLGATPRETNAYLKLLEDKPRLALRVWQAERDRGRTNAYSLALVLKAVQKSVGEERTPSSAVMDQDDMEDGVETPFQGWKTDSWQWNEAVALLEEDYLGCLDTDDDISSSSDWTNPVVTSLLQLNHRIAATDRRHPEGALAWGIWEFFRDDSHALRLVAPDVRTCTGVLTCLGDDWSRAESLLRAMETDDSLPTPNVYTYAATLASFARAGEYSQAWKLLEEVPQPNTVVYNTVLLAFTTRRQPWKRRISQAQREDTHKRLGMALSLHYSMKRHLDCSPDAVTYNTLLQMVATADLEPSGWQSLEEDHPSHFSYASTPWSFPERLVHTLLDQMEDTSVARNTLTYRHAIASARTFQGVIQLLGRALGDSSVTVSPDIFDTALQVLAREGDMDGIQLVLSKMIREGHSPTSESLLNTIRGLSKSGNTRSIPFLVLALMGNDEAADHLFTVHGLKLEVKRLPPPKAQHLTTAITSCLHGNDFENARRILASMRDLGMEPSDESLEAIARSYARLALEMVQGSKIPAEAKARAKSSYDIVKRLESSRLSLQSLVARACGSTGLFNDAQLLLRSMHGEALRHDSAEAFQDIRASVYQGDREIISGLHKSLLKSTADQGNVTAALALAEDIQHFERQSHWGQPAHLGNSGTIGWSDLDGEGEVNPPTLYTDDCGVSIPVNGLGMNAADWNYVLEAASKSGHWKVCINTLQFLRPYLQSIHPERTSDEEARRTFNEQYKSLSNGLISATKCFAVRSQYGWAVRAIEDWILWSGRRPPKQAVQSSIRILSARGRGDEVYRLLANSLQPPVQDATREGKAYELTLYVSAITALYMNGLYDAADDIFVGAVSSGVIPFQLERQSYGAEKRVTLDLHGMNTAVAHSAVRCALQQEALSARWTSKELWDNDMVIITGRGKKSALQMRPILRPEVQRMLIEEFYPPLSTVSVPGNMGALRVSSDGIVEWVEHQRQLKGDRMMAVAAFLKDFSSGHRIREAFSKAASAKPGDQ